MIPNISTTCAICGALFLSTTRIHRTFEKQLARAGWISRLNACPAVSPCGGHHVDRICPPCTQKESMSEGETP